MSDRAFLDRETEEKIKMIEKAVKTKDTSVIQPLMLHLRYPSVPLRLAAIQALGELKAQEAVSKIVQYGLSDTNDGVRKASMDSLVKIGGKEVVEPLMESLEYETPQMCLEIISSLGKLGDERAVPTLIRALESSNLSPSATTALVNMGTKSTEHLLEVLGHKDPAIKVQALLIIGKIKDPRAIPRIIGCLGDQSSIVRNTASEILESQGELVVKQLIGALKDKNVLVRSHVSILLERLKDYSLVNLLPLLSDRDEEFGKDVTGIITRIYLKGLDDKGNMNFPAEQMGSKDEVVIRRMAEIVAKVAQGSQGKHLGKLFNGLVSRLKGSLSDDSARKNTSEMLAKLCQENDPAVPLLIESLREPDPNFASSIISIIGKVGEKSVGGLIEAMNTRDEVYQGNVIRALGEVPSARSVPPLLTIYKQTYDEEKRISIIDTLARIKDKSSLPPLMMDMGHPSYLVRRAAAKALFEIAEEASVDVMIKALKDADEEVRKVCAEGLGRIGAPKAIEPLKDRVNLDPSSEVQSEAKSAIRAILAGRMLSDCGKMSPADAKKALDVVEQYGDEEIVELLAPMADHQSKEVKLRLITAIAKLGGNHARLMLRKLMKDPDPDVERGAKAVFDDVNRRCTEAENAPPPQSGAVTKTSMCTGCRKVIKRGMEWIKCDCGKTYHELCAQKIGTCVICGAPIKGKQILKS